MSAASRAPLPLQPFIDEELARAPLLIDQVLQSVADLPLRFDPTTTSLQRHAAVDRHEGLNRARPQMVSAFCEALRGQVQQAAREQADVRHGRMRPRATELSLVDDDEIEADVELQRTIAVIQSAADYELRELNSFTSALLGEPNVTRDTNPFRPEVYARALLASVRALPGGSVTQLGLMHAAAPRLADALKKAYASACGRLEDQGVEPAAFRTIILPPGVQRVPPGLRSAPPPADLHALRDSMPMPLDDVPPPVVPSRRPVAGARGTPTARETRVDHQVIELLTRLFDALLGDAGLSPDLHRLLSRLQTSAVRVALRDPGMLDAYDHPVWAFMDRLAFSAERLESEDDAAVRQRFVRYAQGLVDNLVGEPSPDGALYTWASGRLKAHDEFLLVQRRGGVQAQIDTLGQQARQRGGPSQDPAIEGAALDVGQLETVPAALIDLTPAAPRSAIGRVADVAPGAWVSLFLQGDWRELQLLWTDEQRQACLFRQAGGATWALKARAFERLAQAGLMEVMEPPSLVRHAAVQVLRQLPATPGMR